MDRRGQWADVAVVDADALEIHGREKAWNRADFPGVETDAQAERLISGSTGLLVNRANRKIVKI